MSEYYVPDLTDMYLGYEYEEGIVYGIGEQFEADGMFPVSGWSKEIVEIREIDDKDTITIPINYGEDTFNKFIRVKYLDEKDVESLGWKWWTNSYLGEEFEGIFNDVKYRLWMLEYSHDILIDKEKSEENVFEGEIKSINELKTLMKWLKLSKI